MLASFLASAAAPMHSQVDALAAANAAAAAAAAAAAGSTVSEPAPAIAAKPSAEECVSYTSLSDDNVITAWCEANCKSGVCPQDKCKCATTARDVQQAAASIPAAPEMGTKLPKIASKISGPWFYCADGTPHEPTGVQRNSQWGQDYEMNAPTGRGLPDWLASTSGSGNAVSLAFMDPKELGTPGNGVPAAFIEYTYLLRQGEENRDRQIFFAIGGMGFKGFEFLGNSEAAEKAGADACEVAKTHGVGIEIDHEGSMGTDVAGLTSFVKGFRVGCPMGKYPLSMDIMGGPGGAGLAWATEAVAKLVPQTGAPGDIAEGAGDVADGDYFDFVNLMVIDACTTSDCLASFWSQWKDGASLNFKRATFSFTASGICDKEESEVVTEAWAWAKDQGGYGLRTWSVTPAGGGDWDSDCDDGAPGLRLMCSEVGVC